MYKSRFHKTPGGAKPGQYKVDQCGNIIDHEGYLIGNVYDKPGQFGQMNNLCSMKTPDVIEPPPEFSDSKPSEVYRQSDDFLSPAFFSSRADYEYYLRNYNHVPAKKAEIQPKYVRNKPAAVSVIASGLSPDSRTRRSQQESQAPASRTAHRFSQDSTEGRASRVSSQAVAQRCSPEIRDIASGLDPDSSSLDLELASSSRNGASGADPDSFSRVPEQMEDKSRFQRDASAQPRELCKISFVRNPALERCGQNAVLYYAEEVVSAPQEEICLEVPEVICKSITGVVCEKIGKVNDPVIETASTQVSETVSLLAAEMVCEAAGFIIYEKATETVAEPVSMSQFVVAEPVSMREPMMPQQYSRSSDVDVTEFSSVQIQDVVFIRCATGSNPDLTGYLSGLLKIDNVMFIPCVSGTRVDTETSREPAMLHVVSPDKASKARSPSSANKEPERSPRPPEISQTGEKPSSRSDDTSSDNVHKEPLKSPRPPEMSHVADVGEKPARVQDSTSAYRQTVMPPESQQYSEKPPRVQDSILLSDKSHKVPGRSPRPPEMKPSRTESPSQQAELPRQQIVMDWQQDTVVLQQERAAAIPPRARRGLVNAPRRARGVPKRPP